jgi:hypothetical protein
MRVDTQAGHTPVLTVVEHEYSDKGSYRRRWLVLDERGAQSSMSFHYFKAALEWAAWQQEAWARWTESGDTFCR